MLSLLAATADPTTVFTPDQSPASWLVILPVVLCLMSGAGLALIRSNIRLHPPLAIAALTLLVLIDALLLREVAANGPITMVMGRWLPPFGIAFTVDVLGASLALVAAIIALSAAIYALPDIDTLRRRFQGPVVADLLCYLRLHTELALRAKGVLMMRENGFDMPVDDATRDKFAELDYLESSIGKTGLLALKPMLHMSHRDLWQLHMLGKQ